jgi:hypothetical protein
LEIWSDQMETPASASPWILERLMGQG